MFLAQVSKGRRGIRGVSTDAPAMDGLHRGRGSFWHSGICSPLGVLTVHCESMGADSEGSEAPK